MPEHMTHPVYSRSQNTTNSNLTLFLSGQGHYGPGHHEQPPKFMTLFMFEWLHESHFWGLFLKFLKNGKKFFWRFWHQRVPPLEKNRKYQKKIFFWKKSYFFFLNLYCTCSKLSFDVYNSHVSKNFKFWHIFAWKFSFFAMVFWQPDWPKLQLIECCFWCLWTAKDQKSWI